MTYPEVLDEHGESSREEHDLSVRMTHAQQALHYRLEFWTQQLVGFIHNKDFALLQIRNSLR